jgi:hypothetical protein
VDVIIALTDRILAIGGRMTLNKCQFITTQCDWSGGQVCLDTGRCRVSPGHVQSLTETPVPEDRDALSRVLGVLRYYMHGVADREAQRAKLTLLSELNVPGIHLSQVWKAAHTAALQVARSAVVNGDWR